MQSKKEFILDGSKINSIEEFYDEVESVFCPNFKRFGRNLHAFNDVLRGGFGVYELGEEVVVRLISSKNIVKKMGEGFLNKIIKIIHYNENIEFYRE